MHGTQISNSHKCSSQALTGQPVALSSKCTVSCWGGGTEKEAGENRKITLGQYGDTNTTCNEMVGNLASVPPRCRDHGTDQAMRCCCHTRSAGREVGRGPIQWVEFKKNNRGARKKIGKDKKHMENVKQTHTSLTTTHREISMNFRKKTGPCMKPASKMHQ